MSKPSYVMHDGRRWYVIGEVLVDEDPGYELRDMRGRCIIARAAECEPWKQLTTRKTFRDGKYVLEIDEARILEDGKIVRVIRGAALRLAKSSKRWPTSLAAIYSMTVKAAVALEKAKRKAARRSGKAGKK
jgi:hypothetical protein